ncbi:MAG TPA: hypothetical protein VNJ01_03135 [Bacteriovoracaceae bacterium]|nr:hypothetical protein [Bacteriovoracaceae bacterium]
MKLNLPFVPLPREYVTLLKSNLSTITSPGQVFNVLRLNKALYFLLEKAFAEFDDGRGLEKTMMALGWPSFRERTASLFIYKAKYGTYPATTDLNLVEDLIELERKYSPHGVNSYSRLFLLGFYLRLANLQNSHRESSGSMELKIPEEIGHLLKLSQGRSEKIDWLILVLYHLFEALGIEVLTQELSAKKSFQDLYSLMGPESREHMCSNLLAYGASIDEPELFLYEKV